MRIGTFALFIGIAYLSAGLLGLIPAALNPPPPDAPPMRFTDLYGYLGGVFPVNVLHSVVHVVIGVWGLAAWHGHSLRNLKLYARTLAVLYGLLAVMGLIPGLNTVFGLLPLHGHDVWLHAVTAAIAAYFGWRSEDKVEIERRAGELTDRRDQVMPVQRERRLGHADRRAPGSEV
jgi:hypothetical protein